MRQASQARTPVRHKGSLGTGRGVVEGLRPPSEVQRREGPPKGRRVSVGAGEYGVRVSVGCGGRTAVPTAQGHRRTGPCEVTGSQSSPRV